MIKILQICYGNMTFVLHFEKSIYKRNKKQYTKGKAQNVKQKEKTNEKILS